MFLAQWALGQQRGSFLFPAAPPPPAPQVSNPSEAEDRIFRHCQEALLTRVVIQAEFLEVQNTLSVLMGVLAPSLCISVIADLLKRFFTISQQLCGSPHRESQSLSW